MADFPKLVSLPSCNEVDERFQRGALVSLNNLSHQLTNLFIVIWIKWHNPLAQFSIANVDSVLGAPMGT